MAHQEDRRTPVLVGHPFAPIGKGEEIRCVFRALRAVDLNPAVYDVYAMNSRSDPDIVEEIGGKLAHSLSRNVNIFCLNGDEVEPSFNHLGNRLPTSAYNIICPHWELSNYPPEWAKQLDRCDEVWAPSRFVFDSLQRAVSKPLLYMSSSVQVQFASFLGRRYFGLPEGAFIFLFFFDFQSYAGRKNPAAVVEAFEKVCALRPRENMCLVIKSHGSESSAQSNADSQKLLAEISRSRHKSRIIVIDKVFTDNETKNLMRCCDCFVSLHRSEGFGRGLAEAMFLGKPVVATGYSGNLDFMNEKNSCLVRYKLVGVGEGRYPHAKGQVWAEPDIGHAVRHMVRLLDDRRYGRKLGQIASRHIRTYFSYNAIGLRYKKRLDQLLS